MLRNGLWSRDKTAGGLGNDNNLSFKVDKTEERTVDLRVTG